MTTNANPDNLPPSEESSYQEKFQGKEIVPWHEAQTKKILNAQVIDLYSVELSDKRILAVGSIEGHEAISVRVLSPTEDNKISNLCFALSHEGAVALHILLEKKLRDIFLPPVLEKMDDPT